MRVGAFALSVLLSTTALGLVAAPAIAQTPATGGGPSVEEIVVTASKREETIKNTPTAITAVTSQKINQLGITDFKDYQALVPSLDLVDAGSPGEGTPIIRGIYSGSEQTTATVGFYLDETPFTPSSASSVASLVLPDPDLADVARVEVLKGPQGTLYGASALGGLIRVISKEPDLAHFGGDVELDGAAVQNGGTGYGVHAALNVPIIPDQLALRIDAYDREDPGYVNNVFTGQKNVNSSEVYGGHVDLRYQPNDRLAVDLNGFYQGIKANGSAEEDLNATTLQPLEGRYDYSSFFNNTDRFTYWLGNLTASYRLNAGTITDATSYASYKSLETYDYTKDYGPLLGFTGDEAMLGLLYPDMDKFTEEVRFSSARFGPFDLLTGLFYTHEKVSYDAVLDGENGVTGAALPVPFGNIINALTGATYDEYAAYGDLTYHLGQRIDATLGVRESYNVQNAVSLSTGLLSPTSAAQPSHSSNADTTYLATARWRPTDEVSTYVRAASGYRPGGPQFSPAPGVPSSFGPDTVWDYEAGAKGVWFQGRLSVDSDVYYMAWSNIQLNALVDGLTVTGNGGNAHSEGVEIEGQARPIEGLTIGFNGDYDSTRIDTISPTSTAGARVGNPLPNVPRWAGALTADYSFPFVEGVTSTLGATYRYQGDFQSSFSGVNSFYDVRVPSYSDVDLRWRLAWQRYALTFRVENLFNTYALTEIGLTQLAPGDPLDPIFASGVPMQPRTYRVTLEARF